MKKNLFWIYRDGIQIWPIGIICPRRHRGIGLGIWKERGSDITIAIGAIFSFHLIHINWKVLRSSKSAGAHNNCFNSTRGSSRVKQILG